MNKTQLKNYLLAHKNEDVDSLIYEKEVNYFTELFNRLEKKSIYNLLNSFWDDLDKIKTKLNDQHIFKNMLIYISELFHCEEEEKEEYFKAYQNIKNILDDLREKEEEQEKYLNVVDKIKEDIKKEEEKKEEATNIRDFITNYKGELFQKGWREGQNIKNITIKIKGVDVKIILAKNYHVYYGYNYSNNGYYEKGWFSLIYYYRENRDNFKTQNEVLTNEELTNYYQNRISHCDERINKYNEDLINIKAVYNKIKKLSVEFIKTLNTINCFEAKKEMININNMHNGGSQ